MGLVNVQVSDTTGVPSSTAAGNPPFSIIYKNKPATISKEPFVVISFIYKVLILWVRFKARNGKAMTAAPEDRARCRQKRYQ